MVQGKYIRTKEHRERHSKIVKEWYKNNDHPKGMLGKESWNKGKRIKESNEYTIGYSRRIAREKFPEV